MKTQSKIHFHLVKTNEHKARCICSVIQGCFDRGHSILVLAPTFEAGAYLDGLLWRLPEESFLPHSFSDKPTKEKIVITCSEENLNQANILFNLRPTVANFYAQFDEVHELLDHTHPSKEEASQLRHKYYTDKGHHVYCQE